MKVNELFTSIQGEGRYTGHPCFFIRLSGCNRNPECEFCDTKYHKDSHPMEINKIIKKIDMSKPEIVVWTGGEPTLQLEEMKEVIKETKMVQKHHLETNGDIDLYQDYNLFDYICFSPKDKKALINIVKRTKLLLEHKFDIKVVTDLELNKEMIPFATMLMPLTTGVYEKDIQIKKDVWRYCVDNNVKYCERIHIDVWGGKKGV